MDATVGAGFTSIILYRSDAGVSAVLELSPNPGFMWRSAVSLRSANNSFNCKSVTNPAAMLSVLVIKIEVTSLASKPSRFTKNSVTLPSYQFAIAFADTMHSRE
jgi:hypothetical protein